MTPLFLQNYLKILPALRLLTCPLSYPFPSLLFLVLGQMSSLGCSSHNLGHHLLHCALCEMPFPFDTLPVLEGLP